MKSKLEIENIYSGFLGHDHVAIVWKDNKPIMWMRINQDGETYSVNPIKNRANIDRKLILAIIEHIHDQDFLNELLKWN